MFGPVAAMKIAAAWRRPGRRTVWVKRLGHEVEIRGATTDPKVLLDTFREGYDFPAFLESPRVVWDLGSNIGLTLARYACLYPEAEIHGVELNPESAELARRNTRRYGPRVSVLTGAVWVENGELTYRVEQGSESSAAVTPGARARAPSYSLDSLITGPVDFVKMDIEGAEREVLKRNTDWTRYVKSIYVEFHNYPAEECLEDLRALGFDARRDSRHWAAAMGVRP